jgi:hydroxylamine reductase
MEMFCRQCEQTAHGIACTARGVCGKKASTAVLQDVLVHVLKGLALSARACPDFENEKDEASRFVMEALFTTVTNVNFDDQRIRNMILEAVRLKERYLEKALKTNETAFSDVTRRIASFDPGESMEEMLSRAGEASLKNLDSDEEKRSLKELILYGMKGMAAYADHAALLGARDAGVEDFFWKGLCALAKDGQEVEALLEQVLECGRVNLKCMETLDRAHTGRFGTPEPTPVSFGVRPGPAVIVSGHDLLDLETLLEQSEGRGISVYTHGEMLPAHAYPRLKRFKHLAGHFGSAWQNQQKEFDGVPAAVLFTTNCIQEPRESYRERVYTTGLVGWEGVTHIPGQGDKKDFSPVIEAALALKGFDAENVEKQVTVGFAHDAVLSVADRVLDAVQNKELRHFFLIGGCDGARPGRNYFTEFAAAVPGDCVILTLACGKFRFNRMDFGDIGGIPRLLDCGQCNDAYSAIRVASALAEKLNVSVNELPLSLVLSWYEQKAVCILLTLLALGIRNIRLGPSLPAFVSPGVLDVLVERFGIKPVTSVERDLEAALAGE